MYKIVSLILLICFTCTSCCTALRSPHQEVIITSYPDQADLIVDGYYCGTTPAQVELSRKYHHSIIVAKEGFESQEAQLRSSHSLKSGYNMGMPLVGAGVGTAVGLAIVGTNTYMGGFLLFTALGALIGIPFGIGGAATDLYTGADCDLYPNTDQTPCNALHFSLTQ